MTVFVSREHVTLPALASATGGAAGDGLGPGGWRLFGL